MKEHKNTHLGLKPNTCPLPSCGKSFSWKANLTRHIGDAHPLQAQELKLAVSKKRRGASAAKRNYARLFPVPGSGSAVRGGLGTAGRAERRGGGGKGGGGKGAGGKRTGATRLQAVAAAAPRPLAATTAATSPIAMATARQRKYSVGHQPAMMIMSSMRSPSLAAVPAGVGAACPWSDAYFQRRHSADPVLPPATPWRPLVRPLVRTTVRPLVHPRRLSLPQQQALQQQVLQQRRRQQQLRQQQQRQQQQRQQQQRQQQQRQQQRMLFAPTSPFARKAPAPLALMSAAAGISSPGLSFAPAPGRRARRASDASALRPSAATAARRTRAHTASEVLPVVFSLAQHRRLIQSSEKIAEEYRKSGATALLI